MKNSKNKVEIMGVVVLLILLVIALILIIKREFPQEQKNKVTVETIANEETKKKDDIVEESEKGTTFLSNAEAIESLGLDRYADSVDGFYSAPQYAEYNGEEMWQLEELFGYWDAYKLDAVADLVRLPRVRTAFTNELTGTNKFHYYGDLNDKGMPEGRGVAVYENNAYYCGDWKNGKRHGKGMWLQIYPDITGTVNGVPGVIEHSYNGEWKNDLPNGKGQEHIQYDLEQMQGEYVVLNAIGLFEDGYYDDEEMYIMTIEKSGKTTDWEASVNRGVFSYFHNTYSASGELPVWEKMEEAMSYRWLDERENINWGISGLKKKD